jgi:hypothetical protein
MGWIWRNKRGCGGERGGGSDSLSSERESLGVQMDGRKE